MLKVVGVANISVLFKPPTHLPSSKDLVTNQEDKIFLSLDPATLPSDHSIHTYCKCICQISPNDRKMPMNDWMKRVQVINQFTSHSLISLFTDH